MSFFGTRRSRPTRVFRPSAPLREKIQTALQDYRILRRMLVAAMAVLLMSVATQAWLTNVPFRVGQFVGDGVLARVPFQVESTVETQRARDAARDASPLVFVQNNDVIDRIGSSFRNQLSEIANVETMQN